MIKLATVFSGIGAVEHALSRMDIDYEIVFACDNGERYIKAQIDSILSQTIKDFELIICDDCSTDSTKEKYHR